MPLGEVAGEVVSGLARLIAHIFLDVVLEILIKGPGYVICRPFSRSVDVDGVMVFIAGLLFWLVVGAVGYYAVSEIFRLA